MNDRHDDFCRRVGRTCANCAYYAGWRELHNIRHFCGIELVCDCPRPWARGLSAERLRLHRSYTPRRDRDILDASIMGACYMWRKASYVIDARPWSLWHEVRTPVRSAVNRVRIVQGDLFE